MIRNNKCIFKDINMKNSIYFEIHKNHY